MTLRQAVASFMRNELGFTGSIFFVPFPHNTDEGLMLLDQGQWSTDATKLRSFPRLQLLFKAQTSEQCRAWARDAYIALNTGRPLSLTPTFRVGRCRAAGPPLSLGPDALGLFRRTLDLEISMRYGADI